MVLSLSPSYSFPNCQDKSLSFNQLSILIIQFINNALHLNSVGLWVVLKDSPHKRMIRMLTCHRCLVLKRRIGVPE